MSTTTTTHDQTNRISTTYTRLTNGLEMAKDVVLAPIKFTLYGLFFFAAALARLSITALFMFSIGTERLRAGELTGVIDLVVGFYTSFIVGLSLGQLIKYTATFAATIIKMKGVRPALQAGGPLAFLVIAGHVSAFLNSEYYAEERQKIMNKLDDLRDEPEGEDVQIE